MAQDENTLVSLLIGRRTPRVSEMEREAFVPPFLAAKYARESAAREAAELPHLSAPLTAALLRASFEDEEEDVRAAARHALIIHGGTLGDAMHLVLTMDPNPEVRHSAFDEALEVGDDARRASLVRQAVESLIGDDEESVRARARAFADASEWSE
ncbi:hypothetical protein G6O69_00970 [Pseudenhygromyxa sp. WMMC2535]|uniref:hypothetical protein n=1 Tax=Pseudenhygromyxa sp. WMMC2535 TaxID=2712867 RepID=UPI0015580C46|nr:hypothetical protein [Pseudenhygromyxa sp. WMMC2535]NVB36382.1 hypothetical protein [Pseudenhygromyxa sp. WMMC2535]